MAKGYQNSCLENRKALSKPDPTMIRSPIREPRILLSTPVTLDKEQQQQVTNKGPASEVTSFVVTV